MQVNPSLINFQGQPAVLTVNKNLNVEKIVENNIEIANIEWRNTVDAVSDMIILEDRNGKIKRCNKATSQFLGKSFEQLLNQSVDSFFPFVNSFETQNSCNDEHLFDPENLSKQLFYQGNWFELNSNQVRPDLQNVNQRVHVLKDIINRKNFEVELQKLYSVVEQSSNGIIITDLIGKIQYLNRKILETLDNQKENLVGNSVYTISPFQEEFNLTDEILPYLRKNQSWQKTFQVKRKNYEVFEEVIVYLINDSKQKPLNFVFIIRDITETRQLESIAEAVNMMENVGYIFSGIRHELGNPINSVKTALTVLQKNLGKWGVQQVDLYVERCLSEISRIEYLLRTLKTFSMYENPRIEPIEINQYMQNFVNLVEEDFSNRGIPINFISKVKTANVLCDPRVLHQVMLNLLANVAAALENCSNPQLSISISRAKKRLVICIEDNGIGMNEKQLSNLFKPFYTSKSEGTGLGLVIVHKMLVKMNGTIRFESKEGIGTQVYFSLEMAEPV
ncbi:MAG: PAS domain S-box protein [Pyrinomonadaceae bacterium]|nr:PAS domain S-box protein [Pyrinomonadaceae bacterium]